MTYTIKYTDIRAFQNKSSSKENPKKSHTSTINKIFKQVSELRSNQLIDNNIIAVFDANVSFVDPLFFILLFDICNEYKSTLVIDVRYMNEKSQHYVHRILTQYSDLEKFKTYSPYKNKDVYIPIEKIEKDNIGYREQEYIRFVEKESISFFTTVLHKKSLINDNSAYDHTMLPILKLRNFELKNIDTTEHEDTLEPYDKRIHFYNQLSLDQSPTEYRTNLQNEIGDLLKALGLESRGLSNSFRDIFFELIDNIRKHTPSQSNAHISFRKDTLSNLYELIVSDNSNKGFLNTYRETLEKELQRLEASGIEENYLQNYEDVIKDIKNNNYEKVLKGLFQVQKSTLKDSDEEIHIHQIPRIAMHFGLPLLVKLLEKLSKSDSKNMPELKLFLHNDNHFFEITYSFDNGISTMNVNCNSSHTNIGTCIIVTFPEDVKMLDSHDSRLTGINFKNSDYKLFIDKRDDIQKQINQFTFFLDKHIADDLDRSSKTIHTCEDKCVLIKFTGHNTFSEFLRNIYLYAYKYEIEDVVVTNVPLFEYQKDGSKKNSENIEHIKLLETIIYGDKEAQYEKSLNVLFYSDRSPEAALVGGRDQKEYCYLNNLLPNWYGGAVSNTICQKNTQEIDGILLSNLFISIDKKDYILPFELFEISDEKRRNNLEFDKVSILGDMLEIYLNEVAKKDDVHIDTGTGYHIDRYMEFKKVFEDSRWVRRLAFRLAMQFPKVPVSRKYYLYGTDKYTNMLISLCYTFLDLTFDRFRYKLFNIYDDFDYETLKQKIKILKAKNTHEIYLVSSVVVNAKKDLELMEDNKDYDIRAIPAIQLNVGSTNPKISPLISIKSNIPPIKITDDKYCHVCEGQRKIPLLEFTKNDPFFVKDTFFDKIPAKQIKSYSSREKKSVKWFDSLNFGHVERGNNHFLYYINTIKFFNQNRNSIKEFLKEDVSKKINYSEKEETIILFTSSHDTNNNFVALVNQEVFSNNAIVLSFNKSRGEANFHDLDSYASFDWGNTKVFFVDDSIASSHTVKYFYQMLRSVPGIMDTQNVGLDGMIVMIDRISSYDETILCSYLRDSEDIDEPNDVILKEKLQEIHAFSNFDIKPIKSEVEECFLCDRNKRYLDLAKRSALDLTTFQMVRRAYKLRTIEYRAIQPAKEKTLVTRFKNYLKSMATIYIYQNFTDKRCIHFGTFDDLLQSFSKKMYEDIVKDKKERFEKYDQLVLKEIIKFQSEIALLKALSFPRLSYYYEIRKWLIPFVLDKLKVEVDKTINKDFKLRYKLKHFIVNVFNQPKAKIDKTINSILECSRIDEGIIWLDEKDIYFLEFYREMTNLHLVNVYLATLGYFEDSKILDTDYIQFFYKVTQSKDVRGFKGDSLLHTYPFAVKFTIADNLEKSKYFEKSINTVLSSNNIKLFERKKKYSYINALKLENTLFWKYFIKRKTKMDIPKQLQKLQGDNDIDNKINIITSIFQKIFPGSKVYLFMSPYASISGGTYASYLDRSTKGLINILDSFSSIDNYNEQISEMVKKVFYGALDSSDDSEEIIHLKKVDKNNIGNSISDTWSNDYDDTYCAVRLTTIDEIIINSYDNDIMGNSPVWFKPIGCIVVEDSQMDYSHHMKISRTVLSIKNYISNYLEREFNYGVIQEAITSAYKDNVINNVNHSIKKYINIGAKTGYISSSFTTGDFETYMKRDGFNDENIYLKSLYQEIDQYSFGLVNLASISDITEERVNDKMDLTNILSKSYIEQLANFFKIASNIGMYRVVKEDQDINIIYDNLKDSSLKLYLDQNQFEYFLFELVFNIVKAAYGLPQETIEIEIESIDCGINIFNNASLLEIKKINKNCPYEKYSKSGHGTQKIIEMLSKNNYTVEFIVSNGELFVSQSGKRYNVCMKLVEGQ